MKKSKPEVRDIVSILNNPVDKGKLKNFIDEAVNYKIKIADNQESIKVLKEEAFEQLGCAPKIFSQLVGITYNNSFEKKHEEFSELEMAIEMLMGITSNQEE